MGRNKENMEHSSASVRKCVAPQAGVLAGSGPPAPESPVELGKAGADWPAWQEGRGQESRALSALQWHGELNSNVLPSLILDQD